MKLTNFPACCGAQIVSEFGDSVVPSSYNYTTPAEYKAARVKVSAGLKRLRVHSKGDAFYTSQTTFAITNPATQPAAEAELKLAGFKVVSKLPSSNSSECNLRLWSNAATVAAVNN